MKKVLLLLFLLANICASAQQWGLYTLYSVKGSNNAYLIDTNSTVYKTWTFPPNAKTGFSTYLIPGDTLVRAVDYAGAILHDGPTTGRVQKVDWNGNITWDFLYSDSTNIIHHDIRPLPNGNVLMIAMEVKTPAQALQAGASNAHERHADKILEVQPTGPTTGNIVWEWHIWDHVCQHHDASKDNYVTSIVDNPQSFDINYSNALDFCHTNGLDYNVALDQIVFSSKTFSEVFVIDHSTTTTEAASHKGGNSGHGGDILYRWGNPDSYGSGGTVFLYTAHDAHWVPADNPYYPNYLGVFNNTGGAGGMSAIDIFLPPYDGYNYSYTSGSAFGPANYSWLYTANCTSPHEGNSQQLPNGNSLICLTAVDTIIEVNQSGNILWRFDPGGGVSKIYRYSKCYVRGPSAQASSSASIVPEGTPVNLYSSATSVTETNPSYTYSWTSIPSGFSSWAPNPSLSPTATAKYIVTITNSDLGCSDTASVTVKVGTTGFSDQTNTKASPAIYPNPTNGKVNLNGFFKNGGNIQIVCSNTLGKTIMNVANASTLDFSDLPNGIYYLTVRSENLKAVNYKVVKIK